MSDAVPFENRVDDHPAYQDDALLRSLAKSYHTPLYIFDEALIRRACRAVLAAVDYAPFHARYACKALTLGAILKIVREEGLWLDASSINEVERARRAGFATSQIYYTGEGATLEVYRKLVADGVLINCTSLDQIRRLAEAGGDHCSIRINPGRGSGAHGKINTGGPASKHGIYFDRLDEARAIAAANAIRIIGVHSHIGSGTDLEAWLEIADLTIDHARRFEDVETINLGGGLPVVYNPETDKPMPLEAWGRAISEKMRAFSTEMGRDIELQIEPGRYVVAACGVLAAEVEAVKATSDTPSPDGNGVLPGREFVIVNTGANHNLRPSLYGAYHPIRFVAREPGRAAGPEADYVVAGYLCESGDVFTAHEDGSLAPRRLPKVEVGDLMAMAGVGAYAHAMKNEYNSMNAPLSVLLREDGGVQVIERRGTVDDLMRREVEAFNLGDDQSRR